MCGTADLISGTLGGKVLGVSDEWFAEAANLLTPTPAIRQPGKMVWTGAWYDGWETRRHNTEPFDWVVVRLGVASGTVVGLEVDTDHFSGNHAPAISVEGCFSQDDAEVLSWKGTRGKWEPILGIHECGPKERFAWKLDEPTNKQYTHVRLNMYPDGGIARFRLYGHAVPVFPEDKEAIFDLAAAQNGGVAVSCSDQHFGTKDNLILPGRGKDMGDGWETARSRLSSAWARPRSSRASSWTRRTSAATSRRSPRSTPLTGRARASQAPTRTGWRSSRPSSAAPIRSTRLPAPSRTSALLTSS